MFGVLLDDMLFGGAMRQWIDTYLETIDSLDHHGTGFDLHVSETQKINEQPLTSPGWNPLLFARIIYISSVVAVRQPLTS